jgi:hypothetical protein
LCINYREVFEKSEGARSNKWPPRAGTLLQIDGTGAKLLIEALSGTMSYETDRRDKRTVWFYVANAFSLLVATITPMPKNEQIKVTSNYDR